MSGSHTPFDFYWSAQIWDIAYKGKKVTGGRVLEHTEREGVWRTGSGSYKDSTSSQPMPGRFAQVSSLEPGQKPYRALCSTDLTPLPSMPICLCPEHPLHGSPP